MRVVPRIFKGLALLVILVAVGAVAWLSIAPPELLKVGNGYAAKIVCSNVFIAGRDPDTVLHDDVQAPGNPLLRLRRRWATRSLRFCGKA